MKNGNAVILTLELQIGLIRSAQPGLVTGSGWVQPKRRASLSSPCCRFGPFHSQIETCLNRLNQPELARVCVYLLLKSNIFRFKMSVWSSGMILT